MSAQWGRILGLSASSIFIVGYDWNTGRDLVLHYNGTTWTLLDTGTSIQALDIWGTSASNLYVVGGDRSNGAILHYDGLPMSADCIVEGVNRALDREAAA